MSDWGKWRDEIKNVTRDALTLGTYDSLKEGYDKVTGKEERRNAREQAKLADQRYATADEYLARMETVGNEQRLALQQNIAQQQQRDSELYEPMERQIVEDLNRGPDLEGEAAIARNRYANDFDLSAQAAQRDAMRFGVQPGSEQARRTRDANTADRAMGMATTANQARREEDDAHFVRQAAFFGQNGSGLKGQVNDQLRAMYGADLSNYGNIANAQNAAGNRHQGFSESYSREAGANVRALINGVSQAGMAYATGGLSLPFSAGKSSPTPAFSPLPTDVVTTGSDYGVKDAAIGEMFPTSSISTRSGGRTNMGQYTNTDNTPGAGAAIRGALQPAVNYREGQ